jgi:pre-mRNA 3'-end-processing factor FIP1
MGPMGQTMYPGMEGNVTPSPVGVGRGVAPTPYRGRAPLGMRGRGGFIGRGRGRGMYPGADGGAFWLWI